jgi:nucleoside-diphosphate-sugar epimerase
VKKMPGKILITGANGSYGSALWKVAKEWGYDVYATDVMDVNEKNYIKADITDTASIKPLAKIGVDAVVHTAGIIDMMKTELHQKVHIEGTTNLIELFKNTSVKVFVSVSSAAIHGGTKEDVFITEASPRTLKDSYTTSKAQQYDLTLQKFGEKSMIIEPSLVYDERNRYLFKEIAELIALNILPALPDNGNMWVGMVHPHDLATGTLMAIERGEFGQSYIICDDRPLKMIEMAKLVAAATNARVPTRSIRLQVLDRLVGLLGMLDTMLPAIEGMEPIATIMKDMGLDLKNLKMPMDPDYLRTHHKYTCNKLKEVTKKNAKKWRVLDASLKKFPTGWKPEIDPFVELPKVLKYWTEQNPPIIKKDAQYPDVIEYLFDRVAGFI